MYRCKWYWRTPRQPLRCSSGSSSCLCRIWAAFLTMSTSRWSSTTLMTVRGISMVSQTLVCYSIAKIFHFCSALLSQSPLLTISHRVSRRVKATTCGLKAQLYTSRWVTCKQASTAWECMCGLPRANWRSFRKATTRERWSSWCRKINQRTKT